MLIIREAQLKTFEEAALAQFEERMAGYLDESFPRESVLQDPVRKRAIITFGRERAGRYGITSERDIFFFLTLMFMLGSWFDEDPQLPWCATRLADQSILYPPARLRRLHSEALDYLDQVAGEENEHLIKALLRIRVFDPASAEKIAGEQFETEMVRTLFRLYPQKAGCQGEEATRAVVRSAAALAAQRGIGGRKATCLLAGIAFMLGSGFYRDPLFPWAEAALRPDAPADLDALQRGAMAHLEDGLR